MTIAASEIIPLPCTTDEQLVVDCLKLALQIRRMDGKKEGSAAKAAALIAAYVKQYHAAKIILESDGANARA